MVLEVRRQDLGDETPRSSTTSFFQSLPRPPLNIQMPPSLPSWILFLRRVGLLSVLIHTPAMALSKISLSSMNPKPENMESQCGGEDESKPVTQKNKALHAKLIESLSGVKTNVSSSAQSRKLTIKWMMIVQNSLFTWVVDQNASILSSPDLVSPYFRITASPVKKKDLN